MKLLVAKPLAVNYSPAMISDTTSPTDMDEAALWAPKRTLTLEAARKHSLFIQRMRWVLIFLSIIVVAGLVWTLIKQAPTSLPEYNSDESVKMINPRYVGQTNDGQPFYLTAKEAVRLIDTDNRVNLVVPVLEFYRNQQSQLSNISSVSGSYDDVNKILDLQQQVVLKTDDGNECTTTHARIYAQTKLVEGDEPIECSGSFGEISGNGYEILDNFSVFVFKNGMQATLEQTP